MKLPLPPWHNTVVRYCPNCRVAYPRDTERCKRCQQPLVDQVRHQQVELE